jgi:nudix-type nucleoside diphosphatase (YffH/AdpP family)
MPDHILGRRPLYEGWLNLLLVEVCLNGEAEKRPLVEHPCGSAVLPYDPARRVALTVRQTRLALLHCGRPSVIEVIAGVDEDGDFAATARREAMEEGGVKLGEIDKVATVWTDPNSSTEQVHLFLAEYHAPDRVAEGGGLAEENERLTVAERSIAEIWQEITSADEADAKTLLLFQALRLRRPALFETTT